MKVVLEFELPQEEEEYKAAMAGSKLSGALGEFYQESIRKRIKYGHHSDEVGAILEEIRSEFVELFPDVF